MLQSESEHTPGASALSLPAALLTKRNRCDSPGTAADAPCVGGFGPDDVGAPALAADGTAERGAGEASPTRAGVSPVANKSPRWRAPQGQEASADAPPAAPAASPLAGCRQVIAVSRGAAPASADDASLAGDADASPPPQQDAEARQTGVAADPQPRHAATPPRPANSAGSVPLFCGAFAARGARPYMEDRHVIVSPFLSAVGDSDDAQAGDAQAGTFVGVYDGHNGAFAAEHAANNLHVLLAADPLLRCVPGAAEEQAMPRAAGDAASARAAPAAGSDGAVADALVRAFLAVDSQILVASAAGGTREGATALVALRIGDALYTAHAGDSRGVAAVGARAVRLTRDHTPACAHEAARVRSRGGQLEFAGCWRVVAPPPRGPPRPRAALAVTRALGDLSFKHPTPVITAQPDVGRLELNPDVSFVVLATDGLWDVLTDQDAVDIGLAALTARRRAGGGGVATERTARALATTLVNTALQRGSSDNVTAIVLLPQW